MTRLRKPVATLLWLLAPLIGIYVWRLGSAPVHLYNTEVMFGLQAHSIAWTARDVNGRLLPLYFQMRPIGDNVWFQPMLVYLTAPFVRVLPLSEWAIRLPTVMVGLIDVVLMYFVARQIFTRQVLALAAAALLALAPAHFMSSRFAMDYLYPVPFVLAWLLCLSRFLESGRLTLLFAATSFLGIGFFSYIAAVVMMPWYFIVTCAALLRERRQAGRVFLAAVAGFLWPFLPLVLWLSTHPTYGDTVGRYGFVRTLRDGLHFFAITDRINIYWSYLNPSYLFVTGGVDVMDSTRRIGVFLLPMAPLLLVGLNEIVNVRRQTMNLVLLIGFFTAPLAALIPAEAFAIDRELEVVPFAVLIAVWGVDRLLSARRPAVRVAAVCLLALTSIQFAVFCADYFGDYRRRSAGQYGGNLRGAIEEIFAQDGRERAPEIYLSTSVPYIESYWRFYAIKERRLDVLPRTRYFDPAKLDTASVPAGALALTLSGDRATLLRFRSATPIAEVNDLVLFEVARR